MKYMLNECIIFDTDLNSLSLIVNSEDNIVISNPTKRLLALLIESHGETVTRNEIFQKVWDDFGMVSSNNNLNHCVSKLRRVIKTLGLEDEVIATVPREGFMLRKEICIDRLGENNETAKEGAADITMACPTPVDRAVLAQNENPGRLPVTPQSQARLSWFRLRWLVIMLATLCIVALAGWAAWSALTTDRQGETFLGEMSGCKVFLNHDAIAKGREKMITDTVRSFAERHPVPCAKNEYLLVIDDRRIHRFMSNMSRLYLMRCGSYSESQMEICLDSTK